MDYVQASRVDGNPQRWGGQNSPQGDKQRRQAHKLQLLYAALKAGELEQARQAFVALVNVDPSVAHDPYLNKIGAALQSSHVSAAQHFARELEQRGGQLAVNASTSVPDSNANRTGWDAGVYGLRRIDSSA